MFFHGSSELSFLTDIPSVVPIHDLQHRVHPEFREVSTLGQWEKREYLYNNIKNSAYRIFVDSNVGKEDVIRYYGVEPERIMVVPFLPPSYLESDMPEEDVRGVIGKYNLPLPNLLQVFVINVA